LGAAFPVSLGFVVEAAKPKTTLQASLKSEIEVSKDIKKIALSDLNTQLSVTSEATQGKTLNFDIRTGVEVDLAQQLLAIQEFVLQFENLKVQSNVQVSNFEAPVIQGDLSIPAFSAQALLAKMGPPVSMSDPKALSAVSFKTSMSMRDNLLTIPDIVMALDQTTFRGGVTVNTASQAITVALSGDRINLDHYLPPGKEGEAAPVPAPVPTDKPQSTGNEPLIPVEVLRPLDLSVSLKLAEATLKDYVTNNMEIYLTAKNGLLELHKADAALYDGTLKTKASLDARTDQVRYSFKNDIMNVNADKFPKSLTRQEFMFGLLKIQPQGKINVNTRYQSQGNSLNSILENGNANLDLYLEKGALEELELLTDLYQLASKFDQNVQDTSKLVAATPFKDLKTQFALEGSQLHHKQYRLQLNRDADLLGSGEVDLAKRTLEYRFNLTPTAEFIEKESKWATAFRNIPLNYVCKADLNQSPVPACKVDRSAIEKAATQAVKDKAKTKAVKEIDRFFDKRKAEKDAKQAENPDAEKSEKQQRKEALEEAGRDVLKGLFK
ncbi:MAG: AsmA-like C-terminal region-containing protein, partial [Pseudomonadales bacterium]|nr:AsmA-like C-terminal region-containing protein [Pseudomonadales bacterium]